MAMADGSHLVQRSIQITDDKQKMADEDRRLID
jgi:hypothetical protein